MDRRNFSLSFAGLSLAAASAALSSAQAESTSRVQPSSPFTFTATGKEERPFQASPEATLAERHGTGYLDHLWFGGDFPNYKNLRLRFYVDGEATPSIDMQLGLGVGVGFEDPTAPWGTKFNGITGAPSGIFFNYRIPYTKSIRVTAEIPEGVSRDTLLWWIVRGLENMPLDLSGWKIPQGSRLRLYKNVGLEVQPLQEFDLCRVPGNGMVFMVTIAAKSTNFEFMEGQMRAYIGKAQEPQFLSSGLEDYFLGTYYFNRGLYHLRQAGLTHRDEDDHSFSAYRFHDLDPIFFSDGLRLSCRCGEERGGKIFGPTGKPQLTTYTTYSWVYEWPTSREAN